MVKFGLLTKSTRREIQKMSVFGISFREHSLMTSLIFWPFLTYLPTLIWDVINERSLIHLYCIYIFFTPLANGNNSGCQGNGVCRYLKKCKNSAERSLCYQEANFFPWSGKIKKKGDHGSVQYTMVDYRLERGNK